MALSDTIDDINEHLTEWQRIHFAILAEATRQTVVAMVRLYIDKNGYPAPENYRYRGAGRKLCGAFLGGAMTPDEIESLGEYWRGTVPNVSYNALGIPDRSPQENLDRLNKAAAQYQDQPSKIPLDIP